MRLLGLLLLVSAASAYHFELDGHFALIPASVVRSHDGNHANFLKTEKEISEKLNSVFSGAVDEFFVQKIEIHSEEVHPTAVFTAFLTTSLPREKLVELVTSDDLLDLFRIKEIDSLPARPLPISKSDAVSSCENGGFLLPNSTCVCPSFYTGESCEFVNCLNGGIRDNGRCACPPGIYAANCEQRGCLPQVQANLDVSQQTFILVVNQRSSMSYVINQLASQLERVLGKFDSNLFANFILVNYLQNKNGLMITKNVFSSSADLITYLNTLVYTSTGNVFQPNNWAILEAQSFSPFMKGTSNIFVFTDSADSNFAPANYSLSADTIENRLILHTLAWRNRIIYFISSPVGAPIYDLDNSYLTYQRVATATLGDLINIYNTEINDVLDIIPLYGQMGTIGVHYGATNTKTTSVQLMSDFNTLPINILLTASPGGNLPKLASFNGGLTLRFNGSNYQMYLATQDLQTVEALKGGRNWNFRAWVQSPITVFTSFMDDNETDYGNVYLSAGYLQQTSMVALGANITTASIYWVNLTDEKSASGDVIDGAMRNEECSYNFRLPVMKEYCTPGPFGQVVALEPNPNTIINRIIPGYCLRLDPHSAPQFTCLNGGTRKGPKTCSCTANFHGTNCEIPFCQNYGSPNPFPGNGRGLCSCPPGYSGDFCDILSCSTPTNFKLPSYSPSLTIVMQNSLSQSQVAPQIDVGITQLVDEMRGKDEYQHFILTTFASVSLYDLIEWASNTTVYTDYSKFLEAVNNVKYRPSPTSSQDVMWALLSALNSFEIFRSPLFLFVDSPANDADILNDVVVKAVKNGVRLTIVITPPFGIMEKCMDSKDLQIYESLADKTGGTILNLCQTLKGGYLKTPISQLLFGYGLVHHRTEVLNEVYSPNFVSGPEVYFYVDEPENDVYAVINCPSTESFSAILANTDLGADVTMNRLVSLPFFGIFSVPKTAVNLQGYQINVFKTEESNDGQCFLQVLEKTKTAMFVLFSSDPSYDGQYDEAVYAVPTSPVLHFTTDRVNVSYIPTLAATTDHYTFSYVDYGMQRTNSCSFEFFFKRSLICDKPGDSFVMRAFSAAKNGIKLYRAIRGYCYLPDGKCANGGYMLENGKCKCPPTYGGKLCESPKCQNGGFLRDENDCECSQHFTGKFCELSVCNDWNFMESVDPRNNKINQITFVLDRSVNNLLVNVQLANVIQNIVDATESKQVPVMYTLITFDQYDIYRIVSTSHAKQFVNAFRDAVNAIEPAAVYSGSRSIDALNEAYKLNIQYPGVIYLFTSSPPAEPLPITTDNYLQQKIYTQVNVFYTPPNVPYPMVPTDKNTVLLLQAAKTSGGRFLALTSNSMNHIDKLIISSTKQHGLIIDNVNSDCSRPNLFTFEVESEFKSIEIIVTGIDVSLPTGVSIEDGEGTYLPPRNVLLKDNGVLILSFNSSEAVGGTWAAIIRTTLGGCNIQVRVDSHIRLYPGFTIDAFDDFVHQVPFSQSQFNPTYMAFRLVDSTNNKDTGATLNNALIYLTNFTDLDDFRSVNQLQFKKRDSSGCAYQYISSAWIANHYPNQRFFISGVDRNNVGFTRTFFYAFQTPQERSSSCLHGTIDNYGQCVCKDQTKWNGDYCQNIICENGGTSSYGVCVCPNGYYGQFCQSYIKNSGPL